jgi:hypothetical protein
MLGLADEKFLLVNFSKPCGTGVQGYRIGIIPCVSERGKGSIFMGMPQLVNSLPPSPNNLICH